MPGGLTGPLPDQAVGADQAAHGTRTRNTSRPSVWAPAAFQGWCIRRPPGNGQLDEILVKFMIKPEIRRVDHEREVARVRLTGQGRDARHSVDLGERAGLAQIDA